MKFSLSWLKDYLDTNASVEEISNTLTKIGLEVEEVIDNASALQGFIVGEIKSVEKHPNADKLNLLSVWTGKEALQIVCGAPNCRVGMKSVLALPGVMIPKYGEKLEKGVIRGIESCGMMCAEDELCLGSDHTGIIDLKTDAQAGTPFVDVLKPDIVFDVNVTPNRGDCFGVNGIARDLAAAGLGTLKKTDAAPVEGSFDSPISVTTQTSDCPLFTIRYIKGVRNGESPDWLKKKLVSVGLRPISALVDITNYFNIGEDHPLHVFDADKLTGNLTVRSAKDGEMLDALDEKVYTLRENMVVVADEKGPQSIAGIMGGTPTGVDENTVNVVLEAAYFNPMSIATTARQLNAESDSKMRFERGVDIATTIQANHNATQMILDLCGGQASKMVVAGSVSQEKRIIDFDFNRVQKLTGMEIAHEKMVEILTILGFGVNGSQITVPSWRMNDIFGSADLVEEIARIYGYDNLPTLFMRASEPITGILLPDQRKEVAVRRALADAGLCQAITWSFMDSRLAKLFNSKGIKITNPIASDLDEMRPSLVPNLLSAVARNTSRGTPDCQIFEVGPEFFGSKPEQQHTVACAVRSGQTGPRAWNETPREVDLFDAKADAYAALASVDAPVQSLQVYRNAPSWYHPGRSGTLCLGKTVLANFGEIHPAVLKAFDIKGKVVACEVFLDNLPPTKTKNKNKALHISSLMPLTRDFAFIMDKQTEVAKLVNAIRGVDKELIADVRLFDVYEGDKCPAGKKSVALEIVIQPKDKTLIDEEIESLSRRIIGIAGKVVGAELRS
ncbi:MAG: phenylalanine--tRNA ligase subunit beta [Alphaproteobacteria bacterium]|nr:phenylalanine--tRNA ligase subunit beta [Alphaproteobacteria bacterium]